MNLAVWAIAPVPTRVVSHWDRGYRPNGWVLRLLIRLRVGSAFADLVTAALSPNLIPTYRTGEPKFNFWTFHNLLITAD